MADEPSSTNTDQATAARGDFRLHRKTERVMIGTDELSGGETAGQVLEALRKSKGIGGPQFAQLTGWNKSTEYRLETGRIRFQRHHLDTLITARWLQEGDGWYVQLEQAIAYEAARERANRRTRPGTLGQPVSIDTPDTQPEQPVRSHVSTGTGPVSSPSTTESILSSHAEDADTLLGAQQAGENALPSVRIRDLGDRARAALNELERLHVEAVIKIAHIRRTADVVRQTILAPSTSAPGETEAIDRVTEDVLLAVGRLMKDAAHDVNMLLADALRDEST